MALGWPVVRCFRHTCRSWARASARQGKTRRCGVFRIARPHSQGHLLSSRAVFIIAHLSSVSQQIYEYRVGPRSKRGSGARNLARARRSLPGDATSIWRYSSGLPCVSKLSEMRARPARGTAVHDEEGRYLYPHPGRSRVSKSETLLNKRSAATTGAPPARPSAPAPMVKDPRARRPLIFYAPSPTALVRGPRPVES